MNQCLISRENLLKLLTILSSSMRVYAPFKDASGDIYYLEGLKCEDIHLERFKPLMPSVRELLFGQIQDMIRYKREDEVMKLQVIDRSKPSLIFGIPSCDVMGINYCDTFFGGREFSDPWYREARKKLTLISLVCTTPPKDSCFCGSMIGGPHIDRAYDIQLTAMGDNFFVEEGSEKGAHLVDSHREFFGSCAREDLDNIRVVWKEALELTISKGIDKAKTLEKMAVDPVSKDVLIEVTNRCISCGACNYTCPTCTCFNVTDWGGREEGVRKRILDSCIFSGYFRMAGGHNPKAKHEARTAQRYYCKLLWDREKYNDSGCVGCGRCLDSCPVDIDIKEVMRSIASKEGETDAHTCGVLR